MNHLTYEECIELKEAGFPQGNAEWYWATTWNIGDPFTYHKNAGSLQLDNKTTVAKPTLESLIDACGEDFESIERFEQGIDGKGLISFIAKMTDDAWDRVKGLTECGVKECCGQEWGDSPIQAVKNLYVALNKK